MGNWIIYTDGSFNSEVPTEVHGACILKNLDNNSIVRMHMLSHDADLCSGWNIGGEVLALCTAISVVGRASKGRPTSIEIVYDCDCAGKWCASIMGTSKSGVYKITKDTKPSGQWCKRVMLKLKQNYPNLQIKWTWVKGHGSNEGNKLADKYASYDMIDAKADGLTIAELSEGDF